MVAANILQCTGQSPTAKTFPVQNVTVLRLRNAGWGRIYLLPEGSPRASSLLSGPSRPSLPAVHPLATGGFRR